jgi:ribosomal protein L11 methylase PrmA
MSDFQVVNSSFRDPSGFLFYRDDILYRQINKSYQEHYQHLMESGLYRELVDSKNLIPHEEVDVEPAIPKKSFKIIKPEKILFISYPYEWSFSQLKEAALTTLRIQKIAMNYDMTLKDANSYNIQFHNGKATMIDTLSFEKYTEGQFWFGYKQFCQHFLAPLALMSHKDIRLNQLLRIYIDGIPLDLTAKLLPSSTRLSFSLLSHIHAHAKSQKHFEDKKMVKIKEKKLGKNSFIGIIQSLNSGIKKLNWKPKGTEWADYYTDTNYSSKGFEHKKKMIESFFDKTDVNFVWDLGANTGIFSRISSNKGIPTISFDIDPAAVEKNFLNSVEKQESKILPLLLDLTNPSASIGWENQERSSLINRGPTDVVLALALLHHLVISNNLPMEKISSFFSKICNYLIIEFIPKNDSQVKRLLQNREDIFDDYSKENFELAFKKYFSFIDSQQIEDSGRILYIMNNIVQVNST